MARWWAGWSARPERAPALPPLEALFRAHVDDVTRMVGRLLGPRACAADVDDVVQQIFIAVDRARTKYRGDSAPKTWVYGIATRVVLQHFRSQRRYRAMLDRFEDAGFATSGDLREELEQQRALRRVWTVLEGMEEGRRVAFTLYELEGMTATEVATLMGVGEEAVRSRVRRARSELFAQLEKDREDDHVS